MSVPSTAPIFPLAIDPSDNEGFWFEISQGAEASAILMPGEDIKAFGFALMPETIAAGVQLMGGNKAPFREGRIFEFWLSVGSAARDLALFNNQGLLLGVELTIETTFDRSKQKTLAFRIANQ